MSRIQSYFQQLQNKKALIPYITAGDPHPDLTVDILHTLVDNGADIIELGIPFSDPMADGPVIQQACERALAYNVSLKSVLAMVKEFRQKNQTTPIVLMGYMNPIEVMGYKAFAQQAQDAGVDGVLVVDIPPEESDDLVATLKHHDLDIIYLLTPTTNKERIEKICSIASGFVYYVSLKGVTGSMALDIEAVKEKVEQIKTVTQLPVGVGFGIKDKASAQAVASIADAVIIGSAVIKTMQQAQDNPIQAAGNFIQDIRKGLDNND